MLHVKGYKTLMNEEKLAVTRRDNLVAYDKLVVIKRQSGSVCASHKRDDFSSYEYLMNAHMTSSIIQDMLCTHIKFAYRVSPAILWCNVSKLLTVSML